MKQKTKFRYQFLFQYYLCVCSIILKLFAIFNLSHIVSVNSEMNDKLNILCIGLLLLFICV